MVSKYVSTSKDPSRALGRHLDPSEALRRINTILKLWDSLGPFEYFRIPQEPSSALLSYLNPSEALKHTDTLFTA